MSERDQQFLAALLMIAPQEYQSTIRQWRARKRLPLVLRVALDNPRIACLIVIYSLRYFRR